MVKTLQCYVAENTNTCDRFLAVLTLANKPRSHRSTSIVPLEWVMPLGVGNLALQPGRYTRHDTPMGRQANRVHLARLANLSWLIPKLVGAVDQTQLWYKENFVARLRVRNATLEPGDWVHIRHQKLRRNKLM